MNKYYDGKVRSFAYGAKEMRDEKDVNACAENRRTAEREQLNEDIVLSWVHLSAILKNSRVTNGLAYNEAVVMLLLYSLGLGIPYFVSAVLIDRLKGAFSFIKRHYYCLNLGQIA